MCFSETVILNTDSFYLIVSDDSLTPSKQVWLDPNNTPWVKKDLKFFLNKNKLECLRTLQKVKLNKIQLENKVERKVYSKEWKKGLAWAQHPDEWEPEHSQIKYSDPTSFSEQ